MGGRDDQHFADPCQHQGAKWIVDHRFVVNRHQLLAYSRRDRRQACSTASGQDDAFARHQVELTNADHISARRSRLGKEHGLQTIW